MSNIYYIISRLYILEFKILKYYQNFLLALLEENMALLDIKFRSDTLGLSVSVSVIIPQVRQDDEKFKVL